MNQLVPTTNLLKISDSMVDTASGAVGAILSIYVGLPLDTIKVRLQTKGFLFRNSIHCALSTIRTEGVLALWKVWE